MGTVRVPRRASSSLHIWKKNAESWTGPVMVMSSKIASSWTVLHNVTTRLYILVRAGARMLEKRMEAMASPCCTPSLLQII